MPSKVFNRTKMFMNFSRSRLLTFGMSLVAALTTTATSHAAPSADQIIEGARMAATLTVLEKPLNGTLRSGRKNIPIALFLKGKNIQFQFAETKNQWTTFHMQLGNDRYDLFEMVDGKQRAFPSEKITQPIAGTDLTYEDLALRFLYWPNPIYEGSESVKGELCYKIRLNKPSGQAGRYESVYVWVHHKFGAFMRIRGHNAAGGLIKEFEVEDVMKVANDVWTLRKMRVATHDPASGRRLSITDVTFETPNQSARPGLR